MARPRAVYESEHYLSTGKAPIKMALKRKGYAWEGVYFPNTIYGTVVFDEHGKAKYLPDTEMVAYEYKVNIKNNRFYISDNVAVDSISAEVTLISDAEIEMFFDE